MHFFLNKQMCEQELSDPWTVVHDPDMNEPYAYNLNFGNTWCGYDSPESLITKVRIIPKQPIQIWNCALLIILHIILIVY